MEKRYLYFSICIIAKMETEYPEKAKEKKELYTDVLDLA